MASGTTMVVPASQPHKDASGDPQRWQSVVSQTSIYPSSRPPEQGELERLEVEIKMLRIQIHESSEAAMTDSAIPIHSLLTHYDAGCCAASAHEAEK